MAARISEAERKALIDTTVNIVVKEASAITDSLTWNVKKQVYEALAAFFEGSIEECDRFIKRGDGEVVYVSPLVLQKGA